MQFADKLSTPQVGVIHQPVQIAYGTAITRNIDNTDHKGMETNLFQLFALVSKMRFFWVQANQNHLLLIPSKVPH